MPDLYLELLGWPPWPVCPGGNRHGLIVQTVPQALARAAGWIARCRALPPTLNAPAVFAAAIPSTLSGPPCCAAAGLARSVMMAAFRTLTRGEG